MNTDAPPIGTRDALPSAARHAPGVVALTATGAGTAMASVCAIGLFSIEARVGGIWSVAAVLVAGLVCAWLASVFARLATVVPSGASMIAYAIRGLGGRVGMLLVVPYFLAMLFLAGFEAIVVGELAARILPLPPLIGAGLFLTGTWAICRAGLRVGYRTQSTATAALFVVLVSVCVMQMLQAAELGVLQERLLPAAPHPIAFLAAVGQALFLFMGFELITAHAEVARRGAVGPALCSSVVVLTLFYVSLALGFASMPALSESSDSFLIPQLAIASQATVAGVVPVVALICILASFTSYNGALLGLSRFTYSLAKQGMLIERLAILHPRSLTARPALSALLAATMVSTATIQLFDLYLPAIFAAATAAALVYASMAFIREHTPFVEQGRGRIARMTGTTIALVLFGLAVAVVAGADDTRRDLALVLLVFFSAAAWTARNMRARTPATVKPQHSRVWPMRLGNRSR